MKRSVLFVAVLLNGPAICLADDVADAALVAKCIEYMDARSKVGSFGGSVLVARDGKTLFAKGYGLANIELDVPNSPDTKFRIASISKQFTAVGIMILEYEGKIKLGEPISKYLPSVPEAWAKVTPHQLMSHTSGVPENLGVALSKGLWPQPQNDLDHLLDPIKTKPLDFKPGEKWSYSNSGYVLLGMTIEKLAGMPYGDFLKMRIFEPLGMNDTGIDNRKLVLKNRASGYGIQGGKPVHPAYLDPSQVYSAGSVYSTVRDLQKWDAALYTEKVLPQASLQKMWTEVKNNYGYGWMVVPRSGKKCIFHGGDLPGFHSLIMRFPEQRVFVAVLTNLEGSPQLKVCRDLSSVALGDPYDVPVERVATKLDLRILEKYVGEYEVDKSRKLTVTRRDDQLNAQMTAQGRFALIPESETKFFARAEEATVTFFCDPKGVVNRVVVHQNGRDVEARRKIAKPDKSLWFPID